MKMLFYMVLGVMMMAQGAGVLLPPAQTPAQQTPVEKVVLEYENVDGARDFIATGGPRLLIARNFLKTTNLASLASDADQIYVLKMGAASLQERTAFLKDLQAALKTYEYHGKHPSKNGEVEAYISRSKDGYINELVLYNPESYTLNILHGSFPVNALLKID